MRVAEAVRLIEGGGLAEPGPGVWADLGCGEGTFTRALARLLAPNSVIHAMDLDRSALSRVPARADGGRVTIRTHVGDFTRFPWPFDRLDGILLANSLHFVERQAAFIAACRPHLNPTHRWVIVEYDTARPNAWVPHPVTRAALTTMLEQQGLRVRLLGERPSAYQGTMYGVVGE